MDFRKPFSRPFKKLKDKLRGGGRKHDGRSGSEVDVERGEASKRNSSSHPEARAEGTGAGRHSQEGTNVYGKKAAPQVVHVDPHRSTPSISQIGEPDGA